MRLPVHPTTTLSSFEFVYHHTPLHYLPAIAGSERLMSKNSLKSAGFGEQHFRTTSRRQDTERGFGDYVHLTLSASPRLLGAKLKRGFPHISLALPAIAFESIAYDLCRYNIAKTRLLRRSGTAGAPESATNGRYYENLHVPVARNPADQQAMLGRHIPLRTMIEVLVRGALPLPADTKLRTYHPADTEIAEAIILRLGVHWTVQETVAPSYLRSKVHGAAVEAYIAASMSSTNWRAPELEFDLFREAN